MSTPAMAAEPIQVAAPAMRQRQWSVLLRGTMRQWRARIGLTIFVIMVLIALGGPLIAPHSPDEFITAPNSPPSGAGSCTAARACSACRSRRP
jgi:ABC-type dipeptide/oligopeptide/nickel transport system permease subunit